MTSRPSILWAVTGGLAAALIGSYAWAGLISANLKHAPTLPWAVPPMAAILVAWWSYFVRGRGWPSRSSRARQLCARANRVADDLWAPALGAGALGLTTVVLLQGVLARLVTLPQQQDLDPSRYPVATTFAWVVTSAVVAGLVEETAFRGYVQGAIERRFGPVTAIGVTGALFAFGHFSHPEVGVVLLPYYVAVAAVYGGLAYATDSTLPGMVLHTGGNMLSALSLFSGGRAEWQGTTAATPTIWQSGPDQAFVLAVAAVCVFAAATVWAYRALRATASAAPRAVL